jgi:hypothetical protein
VLNRKSPVIEVLEGRRLLASVQSGSVTALPDNLLTAASESVRATGVKGAGILDRLESTVRGQVRYQNRRGAIIDPVDRREVQYSTPYFAYAASVLIANDRATDLLGNAAAAMNWASSSYGGGIANIPDRHGEFYIFPLAKAYKTLAPLVRGATARTWLARLKTPVNNVLEGIDWNWRTYAMKGVWELYGIGATSRASMVNFIESSWADTQRGRFASNALSMYEDNTSDPDTIAYDYAARANLMSLVTGGYDGASAENIRTAVMRGNNAGLYLIDPTGQVSNTGRSGNHVWNDVVAAVSFERQARVLAAQGFTATATKFHRAAGQSILSTDRWKRRDGLYQVTKNYDDSEAKRGYADYSGLTNYNGYMMLHLAELAEEWRPRLGENATPAEVGGYALQTDGDFGTAVADAGGVQITAALRGQKSINYEQFWTQLGVTRVSEKSWDSRLGNLSGQDPVTKAAVSLAPAIFVGGKWLRMAEAANTYTATFTAETVTAEMTRVTLRYTPNTSKLPKLVQTLTITRDGVLMTISTTGSSVGVTLPLLIKDGAALSTSIGRAFASTRYSADGDSLNYLLLDRGATIRNPGTVVKGATGDFAPLLASRQGKSSMSIFVYTGRAGEITGEALQRTMKAKKYNVSSALGFVSGRSYVGSNTAGGFGSQVDLNGDGRADATFDRPVEWVMLVNRGRATYVQADDDANLVYGRFTYGLTADAGRKLR